jgi:hypothetical protein
MLDVHPPHEATHTWKDFFIHVATICVGLLIAIGLEQTVEAIHHRHQRHQLEEALKRDAEENGGYIKDDILFMKSTIAWALNDANAIEKAGATGRVILHRQPSGKLILPNAGVWLTAKANGTASLLTAGEQNWLEELAQLENTTFVSDNSSNAQLRAAYESLEQSITGRTVEMANGDLELSKLTPAQRALVVENLRLIAGRSRDLLQWLISYETDREYIFSTPPDRLSDAEELKRFFALWEQIQNANPELRYTFTAKSSN